MKIENVVDFVAVSNFRIIQYIKKPKAGCSAGVDGISSEHQKYAVDYPELIYHLVCVLLTHCLFSDSLIWKRNISATVEKDHY